MMPAARAPQGDDYEPLDGEHPPAVVPIDPAEFLRRPGVEADPGMRLAEQLKRAWIAAGRPRMSDVGDEVGYNKASISKVLSGKMPPAWHLVRKLGPALGVPERIVRDEWHPLWVAADEQRRRRQVDPGSVAGRHQCAECGTWVADPEVHHTWHDRLDAAAPPNMPDAHRWASLRDALPGRNRRGN
jgi:transcriptional regulator with XRE-family HTH domain